MSAVPAAYDGSSIKVLEGLEAVRKRPGMYIGDTGVKGYHHCLWEIVDNSIDEHMGGHCSRIVVTLHADGSASVQDDGRGIPVDIHPEQGVATATVVMTKLHAGGKFENGSGESAYKTSGGLHGVGASCVNALSTRFEMTIERDGGRFHQVFLDGGNPEAPLARAGDSASRGTRIRFWLDRTIFKIREEQPVPEFNRETIAKSLSTRAYLNPGLTVVLVDEGSGECQEWCSQSFVEILDAVSDNRSTPVLRALSASEKVETKAGEVEVMLAFRVHGERASVLATFANNITTPQGGSHEAGFRSAVLRAYNKYAEDNKLTKEAFSAEDVREGMVAAISVRVGEPEFSGQTKEKLANTECNGAVSTVTYQLLMKFFEENPKDARNVIARAERAQKARNAAEKARELVERKNPLSIGSLPGKLADCQSEDPTECELYIVEGDSAGGSAKQGRDRKTQAILPLRGKLLNVQKVDDVAKALKSESIDNIVRALGCGTGVSFDISKLRYHKVVLMTDADVDGSHIVTLILTVVHKFMSPLIELGHIYVAMPPLYRVRKGKGDPTYIRDQASLDEFFATRGGRDGWDVQRFKGLGEMNPEQLWETTMDPSTRQLMRLHYSEDGQHIQADAVAQDPADAGAQLADRGAMAEAAGNGLASSAVEAVEVIAQASAAAAQTVQALRGAELDEAVFDLLMGTEVEPRRAFIEERASYANVDA